MPYCAYGKIYYDPRETSYGYMEELAFAMQRAANGAHRHQHPAEHIGGSQEAL